MSIYDWKSKLRSFDDRRDIALPGKREETVLFSVEQFIAIAEESIAARGKFCVALSGGSTPKAIFEKLSNPPYKSQVEWDKVFLFWSDERTVPANDPDSNYLMAMQAGFSSLPILKENIFRMAGEKDPEAGAANYEKIILEMIPSGVFDLVMLGMGEDGHTASLFPRTAGLNIDDRLVIANEIPQKKTWRLTLTFKCINASRHISIYVIGKSKAAMLKRVLTSTHNPEELPIQNVGMPSHRALWIVDDQAAEDIAFD